MIGARPCVEQVFPRGQRLYLPQHCVSVDRVNHLLSLARSICVSNVDRLLDSFLGRQYRFSVLSQCPSNDVQMVIAVTIANRDQELVLPCQANHAMRSRVGDAELLQKVSMGAQLGKIRFNFALQGFSQHTKFVGS